MSESEKHYKVELINKEDILNELISLNDTTQLFAASLESNGDVVDLEYETLDTIKTMMKIDFYAFIKLSEI